MILNTTNLLVLEEFSKDYSKRIYGREIAKRFSLNQKTVSNILNNLETEGILKFKTEGKNKYYFLNKNNLNIKELIKLVEFSKKISFLEKNKKLKKLFEELENKTEGVLLVFGSYAKNNETKKSDLDLFVLGGIKELKGLESSFNIDINVVKSQKDKFNLNEPFIKEIMENHIVLKGVEEFVNLVWSQ